MKRFIAGLMVLAAMTMQPAAAKAPALQPRCEGSIALLNDNVPPSTDDTNHNVEHTAAVDVDGKLVGWIYQNHLRELWFQLAPNLTLEKPVRERVLKAIWS